MMCAEIDNPTRSKIQTVIICFLCITKLSAMGICLELCMVYSEKCKMVRVRGVGYVDAVEALLPYRNATDIFL
jgi:hypothetical protein